MIAGPRVSRLGAPVSRSAWLVGALALVACATRFALLARGPNEWDEFLFTRALDDFDIVRHSPHPPGYPVFVMLARAARWLLADGQLGLAATGAAGGVLGVLGTFLFARLFLSPTAAAYAALLFAVHPVVWITSLRGLSDVPGLAFALLSVALLLGGEARSLTARGLAAGVLGGLAIGTRPASMFVVLPALAVHVAWCWRARRLAPGVVALWAFAHVCSLWLIGMIVDAGGVGALAAALDSQAHGFYEHDSLVAHFTLGGWWDAWRRVWVEPWGMRTLGWGMTLAAAAGWCVLLRRRTGGPARWVAVAALVVFLGYALFDSLFMATGRYRYHVFVVPLVVVGALGWDPWRVGAPPAPRWVHVVPVALVGLAAQWTLPLAWIQHRDEAPIVRAMEAVERDWRPDETVLHVNPFFVAAFRARLERWTLQAGDEPQAPSDGRRLVTVGLEPDFWAGAARAFRWNARLLDLVSMHVTPYVAERRVFPVEGVYPVEGQGEHRWVWTGPSAALELIAAAPSPALALVVSAPVDPLHHRLRLGACGVSFADLPVTATPVRHVAPLPAACAGSGGPLRVELASLGPFVPADLDPTSADTRLLGVRIDAIDVIDASGGPLP